MVSDFKTLKLGILRMDFNLCLVLHDTGVTNFSSSNKKKPNAAKAAPCGDQIAEWLM